MGKVIYIRIKSLNDKRKDSHNDWMVHQIFWFLMVDKSFPQEQVVLALGYPGLEHEIYAIDAWVQENQAELKKLDRWEGVRLAYKELGKRLDDYYGARYWERPDHYER